MDRYNDLHITFQSFIDLFFYSHAKKTAWSIERAEECEKNYMAVVDRYTDKNIIRGPMVDLMKITIGGILAGGDFG